MKFKYVEAPLAWYREGGTTKKTLLRRLMRMKIYRRDMVLVQYVQD